MNDKCPKCGAYCGLECGCVVAQLRNQLAKAEAEAKRYRGALQSIVDQWVCRSELFNNDRDIAENIVATARIALIPPAERGNHQ